jgi:lipopolysaccharide export system permease protein
MQFLWKYIDDLIGKGVEGKVIFKFMSYTSATLIPMSLPLAVLLSSIMTMGRFGENSELTAAKSNGVSLFRFFKSTIFFAVFVSIFAFYYSNYIYTRTQAIANSMLGDIRNLKPTLLIKPKHFYNGISGMSIRVESKDEKTGMLYGMKIYDHTKGNGNESILLAKSGQLTQSEDGKILIMKLDSGVMYKDMASNSFDDLKYRFYIWRFAHFEKRFDLSQFKLGENFSKNPDFERLTMSIGKLNFAIDSMRKDIVIKNERFDTSFYAMHPNLKIAPALATTIKLQDSINAFVLEDATRFKLITGNKIRNVKNNLFVFNSDLEYEKNINNLFKVEWHRKFTLAISCLVLFFVGAPLGAIIKKGGIGLPMFLAVILFIIYFMLSKGMNSLAENNKITPFLGLWASTILFLPFGIFLTYKAMNDSQLMNIEGWTSWVIAKFSKLKKHA